MSKKGNNFTQYYLLRGGVKSPVSIMDNMTFTQMNIADATAAEVAEFTASLGLCQYSYPNFMEALPSQQIRFAQSQFGVHAVNPSLADQSTRNFNRFHLKK